MKRSLVITAIISLLVVTPLRMVIEFVDPGDFFWHLREVLDLPGGVIQGFLRVILFVLTNDFSVYLAGVDRIINFIWLYIVVFSIVTIFFRSLTRRT